MDGDQEEEDALSTFSNTSNGPSLDSVQSRLRQISVTLESLSTELAILTSSSKRGEDQMLLVAGSIAMVEGSELKPKAAKWGDVEAQSGGLRRSAEVSLNVGGKLFHVSWDLLQQVHLFESCFSFLKKSMYSD